MADLRVSELSSVTAHTSSDMLLVVQAGQTKNTPLSVLGSTFPVRLSIREAAETPVSGALSSALLYSVVNVPGNAQANVTYALAANTHGAEKIIVATIATAHNAVVTVSGGKGFNTITFSADGQNVNLINVNGSWYVKSTYGASITTV